MLFLFSGYTNLATAQAPTTLTTANGTGSTATNGAGNNSFITFVVENTNTYDIAITQVDQHWDPADDGAIASLWYSATSLSGQATVTPPIWASITSGVGVTVTASGYIPTFTNLNFVVPAGAQYRFALQSDKSTPYSGCNTALPTPNIITGGSVTLKVADAQVGGAPVGVAGVMPTSSNMPRAFTGAIHFIPASPCVAPPTGGQAVASSTTVCPNTNFDLSLTGASGGMGMSYQWQMSDNGTSGWTNVPTATNATVKITQTVSNFYRAQLTCSGQTAFSTPVQVTTTATPVTGTFTIN